MAQIKEAPYGTWESPITADLIAGGTRTLGQIAIEDDRIYWVEGRPDEGGRNVLMQWTPADGMRALTPESYNVRTRVHEYGGGAFWVNQETVYFANFADQRLYRQRPDEEPQPLTPPNVDLRYADGIVDEHRGRIICVREDHTTAGRQPLNALVALSLSGGDAGGQLLVFGNDFYAAPRLSPDGQRLAWLTWNHPQMPWDGTELWVGDLDKDGNVIRTTLVAGGEGESVFQPEWSPAGDLHFVSDRTGWWNLYRWRDGWTGPLYEREAEFGRPQWQFGMSTYGFAADGTIVALFFEQGTWEMGTLDAAGGAFDPVEMPYTVLRNLQVGDDYVVLIAGSPAEFAGVLRIDLKSQQMQVLRRAGEPDIDSHYFSIPELIEFPTEDGETAFAYFYPPQNQDYRAPAGEKPPLLVVSHGGPTSTTSSLLNLEIQYWTSRGLAVLDVNYGGSTGYGRDYRERLKGRWGVVDVDDCINGARYLVRRQRVDGDRLAIRGASAGGYTTLSALTFRDFFHAGASYFGVSDLEALARDTHKFESRYLDSMVGPYPEARALYRERSPIHASDRLSCPIIFFQGLEDRVVPPAQAETMVDVLRDKGLPVAYLPFAGEQHGFRRGETIRRTLEAELYFYGKIFGFDPAGEIEPVEIENLPAET